MAERVENLLQEYEIQGKGKIGLETYDPQPDSEEEEWAQRYGMNAQPIVFIGGPSLYFGLVAVSGTKEAAIPFLAPSEEPRLEYLITRLVYEVTSAQKPKVGRLYLIHYPTGRYAKGDLVAEANTAFSGEVVLAKDFMALDLN